MTILDYNRVLRDLNGRSPEKLLAQIGERYTIEASEEPVRPASAGEVGMVLGRPLVPSEAAPRIPAIGRAGRPGGRGCR